MRTFSSIYISLIILVLLVDPALPSNAPKGSNQKSDFNIVLITIDALRADHLSCYGYGRKTSPNIDKIAQKGIIFKNAIAPSSYTVPSMASLFTSLYPTNHGVLYGKLSALYPDDFKKFEKNINHVIPAELTTLAEILKTQGYSTFGISSNLLLDEPTGFAKGFDYFEHPHSQPASYINKIVLSLEDEIRRADKFFLWVHYLDPHFPYLPRDPWIEQYTPEQLTQKLKLYEKNYTEFLKLTPLLKKNPQALSNLIALYDSEINYVDSYVGELIQKFDLEKSSLIIITSDHGEEFLEHGFLTHGNNLNTETINIPFIVKLPYREESIVKEHVNLIDIMPTVLQLLNSDYPNHIAGKSFLTEEATLSWLVKLLLGEDTSTFAEISKENILKTIITSEWKYIYNYRSKEELLYNIKSDPLELNNLIDKEMRQGMRLRKELFDWSSNLNTYRSKEQTMQLTPEEEEKLKAIGYIR